MINIPNYEDVLNLFQLDLEMAFADGETVMRTVEDLIRSIKVPNAASEERYFPDAEATFPRMTYQYAMDRYGVDKPDTRNEHLVSRTNERRQE